MRCVSQPFLSAAKPNLHTQDISHGLSCFFLGGGGDMGVGVQGETSGKVTKHSADCLDVHTILQGNSCLFIFLLNDGQLSSGGAQRIYCGSGNPDP